MQIKAATRYHFTPVRKTIIKKTINNKHWQGCKEIGKSVHCWEYNLLLPLTVRRFLKKFIIEQTYHIIHQFHFWVFTQRKKPLIQKDKCNIMPTVTLCTTAQIWKQPWIDECSWIDEWIKHVTHTHNTHTHTHTHTHWNVTHP